MQAVIQASAAYQLKASVISTDHGHHLKISSLVPQARRLEEHVLWQAMLSDAELRALRDVIDQALEVSA